MHKDTFSDCTEEQRRRIQQYADSHAQAHVNTHLQKLRSIQAAGASLKNHLPLSGSSIILLTVVSFLLAPHLLFLASNLHSVDLHIPYAESTIHSLATLLSTSAIYGCFVASAVFYFRQLRLERQLQESTTQCRTWQHEYSLLQTRFTRMKTAASQITVPYSLDSLVEWGAHDFAEMKGKMRALPTDKP
jgi:uncharacterized integral membrane protein